MGCGKHGALEQLVPGVVVEPVLVRLVALDNGMPERPGVPAPVLGWGGIATADVAAARTAAQVEPPASTLETLHAAIAARRYRGIDIRTVRHSFTSLLHPA